jgi:WD repeat-containing protein 61
VRRVCACPPYRTPSGGLISARQSPDGARVAVGTHAGAVHVFDARTGALAASLTPHARAVRALAWAPDAHLLASGGEDGRLALHDVRHARGAGSVGALPGHGAGAWVLAADAAPDGRLLLSACARPRPFSLFCALMEDRGTDGTAKLWDLGMRAAVGAVQDAKGSVWAACWRPGASAAAFATGAEDGVVRWYRGAGME